MSPAGEDAATAAARLRLDPARVVARGLPGTGAGLPDIDGARRRDAARRRGSPPSCAATGLAVAVIKDSPGFVAPRILAMVVNLACEVAQIGIGTPEDIDVAMRLAQNYPRGPFEWGEWLGAGRVHEMLRQMQDDHRLRPLPSEPLVAAAGTARAAAAHSGVSSRV